MYEEHCILRCIEVERILCLLMVILLMLTFMPGVSAAQFGQITGDGVRLRESPDTESDILAELPINASVEILDESGGWYRLLYEGSVGYVRQDYVFTTETGSRAAYVLEDGVKLRGGPSESAYVVTLLTASQGVKVKQMLGEWYYVVAGDDVGYVHRNYLTMTTATNTASNMLKAGMEGQEVRRMQTELYDRGFLSKSDITGLYAANTREAVTDFQEACGYDADGIAGAMTLQALYDSGNDITKANALATQVRGSVELLSWFEGGEEWFDKYATMTVIDVRTGKSFNIRRFGGWYHADVEPITAADTAIFKSIVGEWTWDRRPIWVSYKGRVVAASMNAMPHLSGPIQSNNFPGHFCIHLYESKVHETSAECPRHQSAVQSAYREGR